MMHAAPPTDAKPIDPYLIAMRGQVTCELIEALSEAIALALDDCERDTAERAEARAPVKSEHRLARTLLSCVDRFASELADDLQAVEMHELHERRVEQSAD